MLFVALLICFMVIACRLVLRLACLGSWFGVAYCICVCWVFVVIGCVFDIWVGWWLGCLGAVW